MSDYIPANISIGGKVKRSLIPALIKAVADEDVSLDFGADNFHPETEHDLLKAKACQAHLYFCNDQARYGQFDELERFCVKNGIAFDRHSDAKYEYNAETVSFRPGMKEFRIIQANQDEKPVVLVEELEEVITLLKDASWGFIDRAIAKLETLCGKDIPPLEPFEIVD